MTGFSIDQELVLKVVVVLFALPSFLWITIYTATNLYMLLAGPVDLKKKYGAQWALVTGASMGIGKAIAESMALQGLNVVLVALPPRPGQPDDLQITTDGLKKQFPELRFRSVAAIFDHKTDYMPSIIEATKDIDVQVVFNNAGYMVTGFFDTVALEPQLANLECNSTACVKITHHFLQKMLAKNLKGCFVFTSSVSGYIPNPFAVMYGATKAFVSEFAASLAIEVRNHGIDVVSVHPSPVASNFFSAQSVAHKIDGLEMAKKVAVSPDSVPGKMLTCIGRCHLGDLGSMAITMRIVVALVPFDFFAGLFSYFAPLMDDYKRNNLKRGQSGAAAGASAAATAAAATASSKGRGRSSSRGRAK